MVIEAAVKVRRAARNIWMIAIAGLLLALSAMAQVPFSAPVAVTAGSVLPFHHGSTGQWGQIYSTRVAPNGSILFLDSQLGYIYGVLPGQTEPTVIVGPAATGQNSNGSTLEASGSYWNGGIAFDANNTLYVTDRYGSAVQFQCVPFVNGTWTFDSGSIWNKPKMGGSTISPQDIFISPDDQTFYVSWATQSEIDKFTLVNESSACGAVNTPTQIITGLKAIATNITVDHAGNLFFLEYTSESAGKRVVGLFEIPANTPLPIVGDGTGVLETCSYDHTTCTSSIPKSPLIRVDPPAAGYAFMGASFDTHGNLFVSAENNQSYATNAVDMILMVPNEGTPKNPNLVWNDAVEVAPIGSESPIALDPRGYVWIPSGGGGKNWALPGTTAANCDTTDNQTINDTCTSSGMVLWAPGSAQLASSPVGTQGYSSPVIFSFSKATTLGGVGLVNPGAKNFTLLSTNPNPDSTNPPIAPCTAGVAYPAFSSQEDITPPAYSWCAVYPALNATQPGVLTAELQATDANNKVIVGSNTYLTGIGEGAAISVLTPPATSSLASGLQTPKQVAADPWGNSYVADPGAAKPGVFAYPTGSSAAAGVQVYKGTAPTGVAVDPAGDLFIGDSGNIVLIPFVNGALASSSQTTIYTGLGKNLNLAADGSGDLYVADADNKQVVKIPNTTSSSIFQNSAYSLGGTEFTGPTAIAADNSGDIFVADGTTVYEITQWGQSTAVATSLNGPVTGLAVDPSGSVFVTDGSGVLRIPYSTSTGGYNANGTATLAYPGGAGLLSNGAAAYGVALDGAQNAYVSYGSGATAGLAQVGVNGAVDWGSIVPNLENDQEVLVSNLGNAPLTFSPFASDLFTGGNAADYSLAAASDTPNCSDSAAMNPGDFCYLGIGNTPSITSGASAATLQIQSNASNVSSVAVNLAANIVVDNRSATSTTVSVTPTSGIVYPGSATVQVTVSANDPSNGTPGGPVALVVTGLKTVTQQLDSTGSATFQLSNMLGGAKTVHAEYGGNGAAGTPPDFAGSAAKTTFTVNTAAAKTAVTLPAVAGNVTVWSGSTYISQGTAASITASITSTNAAPSGTVSFQLNGTPVDPAQATSPLDANGNATFSTANLPVGVYSLTAVYSGDQNYSSVSIPVPAFQVIVPSVQITASPASLSTSAGTPVSTTLTLMPLVGFSTEVGIQCVTASLPQYSECTFLYPQSGTPSITLQTGKTGPVPATIQVTLSTNVPVNVGSSASLPGRQSSPILPVGMALFSGLGLAGVVAGRKRLNRYLQMVLVAVALAGVFGGLTACTNIGYSTTPPAPKVATPAGSYNIQIVTVNPKNGAQNSLTTPVFSIPVTIK